MCGSPAVVMGAPLPSSPQFTNCSSEPGFRYPGAPVRLPFHRTWASRGLSILRDKSPDKRDFIPTRHQEDRRRYETTVTFACRVGLPDRAASPQTKRPFSGEVEANASLDGTQSLIVASETS